MQGMYSMRSPAVKRLMKEAQELNEPTEQYFAQPLEDNLFEWHFTLRGPGESEFDGGLYHGRIILPPDYPMKPPSIILLTPNGRFETNKKICLSISGHHPESWQPSWSIRTALLAIIGFMPTHGAGAIGSLDYSSEERKKLAKRSKDWKCPTCGNINNILKPVTEASEKTTQEAKELASQINFQGEKEKNKESTSDQNSSTVNTPEASQTPVSTQSAPSQQSPQGFPQYQFSRFPFPSPFMQFPGIPQYNQSGNSSVPRFPPPPPFIPAMFPPYMSGPGQGGLNTGMFMSYYQNIYNSQTQSTNSTSSTTATTSTTPSSSVTPAARVTPSSVVTTTSGETNISTSTRTEPATVPKTKSIRTDQIGDSVKTQTESSVSTEKTASDGISNESVIDEASGGNTETRNTSSENITGTEGTTVRQRAPATSASQNSVPTGIQRPAGTVGQNAELREHNGQSRLTFSTLLILVISLAIAILLIRRFVLSRNWKFHYGM